ncbi:LacI family DNA-binding transcriptional regulator [Mycetocola reblochoni]|nr:LacI family DNA-binding transcriptional regulator [Mycetocola reblochoni]RLP69335.1 LacI family transcriptional regulator [Mycetocola reblochoni]
MKKQTGAGRAPNIRDVAARAGVSHQTVSRVLNGSDRIRESTRQSVLDAIKATGYRPNSAARALVTRRSGLIGVLSTHQNAHYGPQTMQIAMERTARQAGYQLVLVSTSGERGAVDSAIERLLALDVEALIVLAPRTEVYRALAGVEARVPVLALDSSRREGASNVAVDQFLGSRLATRHLIDLGHKEIVHVGGPQDWIEAEERMQGYLFELGEAELEVTPPILGELSADFGYLAGRDLLRGRRFTGIVAINDQVAIGLLHAFREAGADVPARISVVGFDDIPEAAHIPPGLTTVRQDFVAVGERVVEAALAEIVSGAPSGAILLEPTLEVRGSTAPPTDAGWWASRPLS